MLKKLEKRIGAIKVGNVSYDAMKSASINEMHEKINELIDFINKLYEINCTQNNQIARLEQEVRELGGFKPIGDK